MRPDPTDPPALEPVYTKDELARLAKQSRRTIEHRIADGTIRAVHLGGSTRITTSEARRYLTGGGDVAHLQP